MTKLDEQVMNVYETIFSVEPEERLNALTSWWAYLNATCTEEHPCIECQREKETQGA